MICRKKTKRQITTQKGADNLMKTNPSKKVGKMAKKVGKKVGRHFSNYNKYVIRPKTKWAEKQKWAGCIPRGCRV